MKWLNLKRPFFLTILILCGFTMAVNPDGVIAKEKKTKETKTGKPKTITTLSEQELADESAKKDKKGTETAGCVVKKITTVPERELVVERGKGVTVAVRLRCKGDIPAVGVTVKAATLKGKKAIEISPVSAVTNEDGKALFTVTGNKKTEEDLAEIVFTADGLAAKIAVRVRRTECKPGIVKIEPEKELLLEQGKSGQITVKVKCENGSPAADAKVDALVQVGSGKIDLSSSAELTDASGKAFFTVTGIKETKKEPATIRFTTEDLKSYINVTVLPVTGGITPQEEATPEERITPGVQTTPEETATPKEKEDVTLEETATPEVQMTPQEETLPKEE